MAVPVKNEADRITACVLAISNQNVQTADTIILLVNNTTDATAIIVRELAASLSLPLEVIEHDFPTGQTCAGAARRIAMERAVVLAGECGVLLTTDADGRVPPDWVQANLFHLRRGIDAVAGRAILEPADAALIPVRLRKDDDLECAYAAALDKIASIVHPQAWDPWPRHTEHSGASIAVTVAAYRSAGGMPAAAIAEDRKFFAALQATGAKIRHAPEIMVTVSGRIVGRAAGGMADTIRRRLSRADPYLDDALEPALDYWRRLNGDPPKRKRLVPSKSVMLELAVAHRIIAELTREQSSPGRPALVRQAIKD